MSPKSAPRFPSEKPSEHASLPGSYWSVDANKSVDDAKAYYRTFYDEVTRQLNSSLDCALATS